MTVGTLGGQLTVWYRCHMCAPSMEWVDDEQAAVCHMLDTHGFSLERGLEIAWAWSVDTTTPGLDQIGQEDT